MLLALFYVLGEYSFRLKGAVYSSEYIYSSYNLSLKMN